MTELDYYNRLTELPSEEVLRILYVCIEVLGSMSLTKYAEMECVTKPVIIQRIKDGKIKAFEFENRSYPLINYTK